MNYFLESIGGLENGWRRNNDLIFDAGFFSVGYGWYPLIKDLIIDLIDLGWDKQIIQVKEKFGGLRFYINEGSEKIFNRISEAEKLSYELCEICGNKGELRKDKSWITTLCDNHNQKKD